MSLRRVALVFFALALLAFVPLRAAAQVTPQLQATFSVENGSLPTTAQVGQRLSVAVTVKNSGRATWVATGENAVALGYRWARTGTDFIDPADPTSGYASLTTALSKDMAIATTLPYTLQVAVPNQPGDYMLHIDAFQKGKAFADSRESQDLTASVKVSAASQTTDAQTATIEPLPLYSTSTAISVSWRGAANPTGYDVQYRLAPNGEWTNWLSGTSQTTTVFYGTDAQTYLFRVRAAGAGATWPAGDSGAAQTSVDTLPPTSRVDALPPKVAPNFVVRWSSYDNFIAAGPLLYDVQYQVGTDGQWQDWLSGASGNAALFHGLPGQTYAFRSRAVDYAGNQGDYPAQATAQTSTSAAFGALSGTTEPATTAATNAYFPTFTKNSDLGTMGVVITNPTNHPVDVYLRYTDRTGQRITTDPLYALINSLAPGATANVSAANLPVPNFTGSLVVNCADPVLVYGARLSSGVTGQAAIIRPAHESGTNLYLPLLQRTDSEAATISLMRLEPPDATNSPITATITYYSDTGTVVKTRTVSLAPAASQRVNIADDVPGGFTGSAIISATGLIAATAETSTTSYPATAKALTTAPLLPVYRNSDGLSSTVVLFNPTGAPLSALVELVDDAGMVQASLPQTVNAHSRVLLDLRKDLFKGSNGGAAGTQVRVSLPNTGSIATPGATIPATTTVPGTTPAVTTAPRTAPGTPSPATTTPRSATGTTTLSTTAKTGTATVTVSPSATAAPSQTLGIVVLVYATADGQ